MKSAMLAVHLRVSANMFRSVFILLLLTGCSTLPLSDSEVMIRPAESAVIEVEEEGEMICVTENGDLASRTCVPRLEES